MGEESPAGRGHESESSKNSDQELQRGAGRGRTRGRRAIPPKRGVIKKNRGEDVAVAGPSKRPQGKPGISLTAESRGHGFVEQAAKKKAVEEQNRKEREESRKRETEQRNRKKKEMELQRLEKEKERQRLEKEAKLKRMEKVKIRKEKERQRILKKIEFCVGTLNEQDKERALKVAEEMVERNIKWNGYITLNSGIGAAVMR